MSSPAADHAPLAAAAASHTGLRRENNEDRYHCDPERGLFMVIDGVGGQAAGERAAEAALRQIRARLDRETGAPEEQLREAITLANNEVFRLAQSQPDWTGMACVLTVAMVRDSRLVAGHVGDTRLYVFRDGRVQKVTHDHSPIGEREDNGEIGEREAMEHPRRNEVYRDVGYEPHSPTDERFIEVVDLPFDDESALLLCSDGLSDLVASADGRAHRVRQRRRPGARRQPARGGGQQPGGEGQRHGGVRGGHRIREGRAQARRNRPPAQPAGGRAEDRERRAAGAGPTTPRADAEVGRARRGRRGRMRARRGPWIPGADPRRRRDRVGPREPSTRNLVAHMDRRLQRWGAVLDDRGRARAGEAGRHDRGRTGRVPRAAHAAGGHHDREHEASRGDPPASDGRRAERGRARARGGRRPIDGFRIAGDAEHPLGVGIRVGECQAEIDDVEISGAIDAGIVLEKGARAVVRGSYIHDSVGAGIVVRSGAAPQLWHNVVTANGKVAGSPVAGIELEAGAVPVLFGNIVRGNGDDQIAGLPPDRRADVTRDNIVGPPPRRQRRRDARRAERRAGSSRLAEAWVESLSLIECSTVTSAPTV